MHVKSGKTHIETAKIFQPMREFYGTKFIVLEKSEHMKKSLYDCVHP